MGLVVYVVILLLGKVRTTTYEYVAHMPCGRIQFVQHFCVTNNSPRASTAQEVLYHVVQCLLASCR
jgi:hypothetical protein